MGIEPIQKKNNLSALLNSWTASKDEFPKIKDLPPEDIDI